MVRRVAAVIALVVATAIGAIPAMGKSSSKRASTPGAAGVPPGSLTSPSNPATPPVPAAAAPSIAQAAQSSAGAGSAGTASAGESTGAGGDAGAGSAAEGTGAASPQTSPPSAAPGTAAGTGGSEPQIARVTGLSFVLDALDTLSGIGLGEAYGLAVSAIGTIVPTDSLPAPVASQAYQILAVPPAIFEKFKEPTAQGFRALRTLIAPLAAFNPGANALMTAMSNALIAAGTTGAPLTNPLNDQVVQAGKFLLVLEEGS